jgi:hypothetical protein
MNFRLDKKIQYKNEVDNQLYRWCLNEIKDGKTSANLIPWRFNSDFIISSLTVVRNIEISSGLSLGKEKGTTENTFIRGFMYSGSYQDGDLKNHLSFSMFGTDRLIENFELHIFQSEGTDESCTIWGCPSYVTERDLDIPSKITEDAVIVEISLHSKRFNEFVRSIESKQVQNANVRLSNVSGFYDIWSPSIRAYSVKILTDDHRIDGLDELGFKPPTLGAVGDFSISLFFQNDLEVKAGRKSNDFYRQFDSLSGYQSEDLGSQENSGSKFDYDEALSREREFESYLKRINGIKIPLWIIVAVLVLMMFN